MDTSDPDIFFDTNGVCSHYIYDMGLLTIEETTDFLSKDGVQMGVKWSVGFRPRSATLPDLHRNIGPEYADKVVVPEIASAMRQMMGNYSAEEILGCGESNLREQVAADVLKQFSVSLVVVQSIQIHKLSPPSPSSALRDCR